MILFLHNRYRTTGGEERVVADLRRVVTEELGEATELLERDSAALGRVRAATGLLRGGLEPDDVARSVRRTGARIVHAHNLNPSFGWRALAAARAAGARTVLHLHNFRLVCAVGTCFTRGEDCTRCHGRDTRPGIRLNCRQTGPEAVVYGAGLALHQRRLLHHADRVAVPSDFALARLHELGVPLDGARADVVGHVVHDVADGPRFDPAGPALVASRLAPEKGVDVAIDACRAAGVPLVVAGDGPGRAALEARAAGADVSFLGTVSPARLGSLRARARVALVPSRSGETFGLAAAEAMAAGLPVLASDVGALREIVPVAQRVAPGDADALARALAASPGADAARAGLTIAARFTAARVATELARVYERAAARA